ncbi:MAG: alpha/beta hydrolase [Bacteroidales bacterium]|nr:alpha/beta hydrolase [Bacteroidales bacterium]
MSRIFLRYFLAILFICAGRSLLFASGWNDCSSDKGGNDLPLVPYLCDNPSGVSVIVCPGGSYCWHDYETEGISVAKWLNSIGISAFILKYQVIGFWSFLTHDRYLFPRNDHPDMISDLQRAIKYVRKNSKEFNIDPQKLGVMGFSAGGHLVMSSAMFCNEDFTGSSGGDDIDLKPNFIASIYPVVTFVDEKYVHKRSRRALLGEGRRRINRLKDSLSLELNVPDDSPPVFLMNCKDDPIVKYQNSILLDSALTAKGISHKYILYNTGGHGFGADSTKTSSEAIQWLSEFKLWLDSTLHAESYERK